MGKIHQLSQEVITQIAAGEIMERPGFAVKELLDNAIDADADRITIHIEDSGLKRINVIDNGEGMSREDLEICFLPHTTSKINSESELIGVRSLGFRGEALSSMAAISHMVIKSRVAKESGGAMVEIMNGHVEQIRPIGTPVGTIITINNLFHNIPARKKFLKSKKTEFRFITEIVIQFALSYPHIHFTLTHNNKTIFDLPKRENKLERITLLLGKIYSDNLLPIKHEEGYITLSGFIGKPIIASRFGQKQYIFVNKRHVTDKIISLAIKEAFGTLLPATSTPAFLLDLSIPYEAVDVNVHPRKETVAFLDAQLLFSTIKAAVMTTLSEHNITFNMVKFRNEHSAKKEDTTSFAGTLLKETVLPWNRIAIGEIDDVNSVTQIHSMYLCTTTKDGLVLIDQHAAHERILYEELIQAYTDEKKRKRHYTLPKALPITLSIPELQVFEEYENIFINIGFVLDHFQGTTILVRSVPFFLKGRNSEKVLKDCIEELANGLPLKDIDTRTQRMVAYLSCRAAIKAGDTLTQNQCTEIIEKLHHTKNNATCPHGRPTKILLSLEELHRLFRRK